MRFVFFLVVASAVALPHKEGSVPAHIAKVRTEAAATLSAPAKPEPAEPAKEATTLSEPVKPDTKEVATKSDPAPDVDAIAEKVTEMVMAKMSLKSAATPKPGVPDMLSCSAKFEPSSTCCNTMFVGGTDQCTSDHSTLDTIGMGNCQSCTTGCKQYMSMCKDDTPDITTSDSGGNPCFAKEVATACRLLDVSTSAEAAYDACYKSATPTGAQRVLMADLKVGDRVLTADTQGLAITRVVANQHLKSDLASEILTFHTASGSVSLTPDHALFVDGALAPAADAKAGSALMGADGASVIVQRITKGRGTVINPVTIAGTILASEQGAPVLAASNPMWIAGVVLASPTARAAVNAALFLAGDVDSIGAGLVSALAKIAVGLVAVGLANKLVGQKSKY